MDRQTGTLSGWTGAAFGAASAFVAALLIPPGVAALFSNDPFRLGLPQFAAALAVSALVAWLLARAAKSGAEAVASAQAELVSQQAELKHQTGLAQGILGGLPLPFLLVDENERAVCSNQACLEMLELSGRPQDYYGQTLAQIFYNDASRKTAVGRSINGGEVFKNLEVTIAGHRGGKRNVLANVFPLYDTDKKCIGGLCLYLDMTALKEKEQLILEKNENAGRTASAANALCERLRDAAARLSEGIGQTAGGSQSQKSRIKEISTVMAQMTEAVVDVARSASDAARGADQARQEAEQGGRQVEEVIAAIGSVAQRTTAMQERLVDLGKQVNAIWQILNVINDIADQTNLLALNAAIEAARAGDAGRGFAVVADEVRKLAEKTMTATKEVAQAITSVQEGARRAAEGMSGAAEAVEKSTGLADGAGRGLRDILRISQGSADQVRAIAAASEQQSASAEEISHSVEQMREVADRIAQDMAGAEAAVAELAQMARELEDIIGTMQAC